MAYQVRQKAEQLTISVRGLNYRVYRWGEPEGQPVFLLHGWADTAMSYQFLADSMDKKWCLLGPDWRGFGDTQWDPQGYWFPDYLADLDVLIETFSPESPVRLVGHSMGGNIICLYAGIFPDRVSHVCSLDQFGLRDTEPDDAPGRYAKWIQQWRTPPVNGIHKDIDTFTERLKSLAPHISAERAEYLAPFWCRAVTGEGFTSKIDPGHKRINPVLYRRQEARACWRRIEAKTMLALGDESKLFQYYEQGMAEDFKACFDELDEIVVRECGHMMHLDQPEQLARILDDFLKR